MSRVATPQQGPQTTNTVKVPHELVAKRAFEKWCQKGRPQGTAVQDWLDAERELQSDYVRNSSAGTRR